MFSHRESTYRDNAGKDNKYAKDLFGKKKNNAQKKHCK